MGKQQKGGRPSKRPGERMAYHVNVKMRTVEYYTLKAKAREAGVNLSECIRQCIEKGFIKERLTPEKYMNISENFVEWPII
jgi:hypothetical protein